MIESGPSLTIRVVVGGNAILEVGNAHVLVYAETDREPVQILLPPAERWQSCVAADFPLSYEQVWRAIEAEGLQPVVSQAAAVSSSTGRG